MFFLKLLLISAYLASCLATLNIRRTGWLDRVVEYYRNQLIEEIRSVPYVQIKASLEPAPQGYTDSPDWSYTSVIHLMTLLKESAGTEHVRRAIRRSLQSSRRFMSVAQSIKAFPSLAKDHPNHFYYDIDSGEYYADVAADKTGDFRDDDIIVVQNPVEARLPSARISVRLLREILENRAKAARYMPSTEKDVYTWAVPTRSNKKETTNASASGDKGESSPGGAPSGPTAASGATAAKEGTTPSPAPAEDGT